MRDRSSIVHSDPELLGKTVVFVGTRVPARILFEFPSAPEEFLDEFPSVSREQAVALLELAEETTVGSVRSPRCVCPRHLAPRLLGHRVSIVQREGWSGVKHGALPTRASERFDAFVTGDQSLQYQQNHATLRIGIIVLVAPDDRVETIVALTDRILDALKDVRPDR